MTENRTGNAFAYIEKKKACAVSKFRTIFRPDDPREESSLPCSTDNDICYSMNVGTTKLRYGLQDDKTTWQLKRWSSQEGKAFFRGSEKVGTTTTARRRLTYCLLSGSKVGFLENKWGKQKSLRSRKSKKTTSTTAAHQAKLFFDNFHHNRN